MTAGSQATQLNPTDPDVQVTTLLGMTRIDLVRNPQVGQTARQLALQWAQDRALTDAAIGRLTALVDAAVGHGVRFDPRRVTIRLRWLDPDRVRVDVKWRGCSGTARATVTSGDIEVTVATLDAYAEDWGFGISDDGPVQWMIIDTR